MTIDRHKKYAYMPDSIFNQGRETAPLSGLGTWKTGLFVFRAFKSWRAGVEYLYVEAEHLKTGKLYRRII